jgi:predicted transposase YdaD
LRFRRNSQRPGLEVGLKALQPGNILLVAKLETIPLLKKLGFTIAEIAKELDIDVELVNRFVANQNN